MSKIPFSLLILIFASGICFIDAVTIAESSSQDTIVFTRIQEPNEKAFSVLIPKGWKTHGGIIRVNPLAQGGAAQSIAAKLDFYIMTDDQATIGLHWFPESLYCDMRRSPAGQMGLFPQGSNYNGMLVWQLLSAEEFLMQGVFSQTHPKASNVSIIESKKLPQLANKYRQNLAKIQSMVAIPLDFSYDAAVLTVTYNENGVNYKEKLITVIEDMGQIGGGIWVNKETFHLRAPANEFDKIEPIAYIIQSSVKINRQWLVGEIKGQIQRGEIMLKTQQYINEIDKQITQNRMDTNDQIRNDMYLTLTSQEEYINPYTKEVEVGSNEWQNRWINESGDVVYSDNSEYNPNHDDSLKRTDFKLCPVKPRK